MILCYFEPLHSQRPDMIGHSLARRAYPLDSRTPKPLERLVKRLR